MYSRGTNVLSRKRINKSVEQLLRLDQFTTITVAEKEPKASTSSAESGNYGKRRRVVTSSESEGGRPTKRGKQQSSTGSADLDYDTTPDDFSKSASKWKSTQLEALHVFYAETPLSLTEILEKLRPFARNKPNATVASAMKSFRTLLKEKLTFSVDLKPFIQYLEEIRRNEKFMSLPRSDRETREQVEAAFEGMLSFSKDLTKWIFSCPDVHDVFKENEIAATDLNLVKSLLNIWSVRVLDFVMETKRMLNMYLNPPKEQRSKGQFPGEGVFTCLIRFFTEMYFLKPESGEKKKNLKVRGHTVGVVPDIRYLVQDKNGCDREKLVLIIEVKCAACKKPSEKCTIHEMLSRDVLGQIGLELISERLPSYFSPTVLGIVCMRTEVIVMILDMSKEHFADIAKEEIDEKHSSMIFYSRPFDILIESDRNQLSEMLFWLGAQQCSNFEMFTEDIHSD